MTQAKPGARAAVKRALGVVAALLAAGAAGAEPVAPPAPLPDASALARRAEDVLRGQGTSIEATMTIFRDRRPRTSVFHLRVFDDRRDDRALVRVLEPVAHAGIALLKLPPNLWHFSPAKRETTRIPAPGWGEPFLGSDFTRGDLVHGWRRVDDYAHRVLEVDEHAGESGDRRAFVVEYAPNAEARVARGRIVAWIDVEHATPLRLDFYAADGALSRTLRFEDLREVGGRRFPHRWVMRRVGADSRETRIEVDAVRFDPRFEEGLFTTRRLEPGAGPR